ncbi:hypothetical protein NLG97_g5034 [Lecanicillium saksenae]|uniref:Uncharacterized protein n=1 Tax=Lecanicillium saksenae TaxID=468837 RepID=A0ACC1QW54_9HYPO|nr:hypothetical protein NLG97_g5034 [Lecanicillium saksenae]
MSAWSDFTSYRRVWDLREVKAVPAATDKVPLLSGLIATPRDTLESGEEIEWLCPTPTLSSEHTNTGAASFFARHRKAAAFRYFGIRPRPRIMS